MRIGNWKIVFVPPPFGPGQWQLYNIHQDPGEVFDLKDKEPQKYSELCAAWDQYLEANGVVWGAPMPSETIDGEGLSDVINDGVRWMK
jgi:arylsulfatase